MKLKEAFEKVGGLITLKPINKLDSSLTSMAKNITEKSGKDFVNETIPAFPREWKNLDKACDNLYKAVYSLEKAVAKKDRKSAKEIKGLFKYTEKNIKLGNEFANQPVVMSRELTEALRTIANALLEHKHIDAMGRPTSSPTIAAPPPAKAAIDKINTLLGNLEQDNLGRNTITSNTIWAHKGEKNNDST